MTLELAYKKHYDYVLNFATSLIHDYEAAKDILQDVFLKLSNNGVTGFENDYKAKACIVMSVKNRCLNHFKHEKTKKSAHQNIAVISERSEEIEVIDKLIKTEIIKLVYSLVPRLSDQQQRIFLMRHIRKLEHEQIAAELNISASSVRAQYKRCVDFFVEELKKPLY